MTPGMEEAALQLINTKMAAIRALAATREGVLAAEAHLGEAQREDAAAYAAAQRAGWTPEELKQLGAKAPTSPTRTAGRTGTRTTRPRRIGDQHAGHSAAAPASVTDGIAEPDDATGAA